MREVIQIVASLVALLLAAILTWEMVTPELWRIGLAEWLDYPIGLAIGIWVGLGMGGRK